MARRQTQRSEKRGNARRSGRISGGSGPTVAGLAALAAVLAGGAYIYRHTSGPADVAVRSMPENARPAQLPGDGVMERVPAPRALAPNESSERPDTRPVQPLPAAGRLPVPPFGTSEEVFESGARLYAANCAGCHGRPGSNGRGPLAAQFWDHSNAAGTHAIAQPTGELYLGTAKGNLAGGMPSYGQRLTDTQIWDLALLMKSAHDDLPDPVMRLLRGGQ